MLRVRPSHYLGSRAATDGFRRTRRRTESLTEGLSAEDMVVQSMPDASPAKWHLAHTTWFFEKLVLEAHINGYEPLADDFYYLYNSYYHCLGGRHPRGERGLITRPSLEEVREYRAAVTGKVVKLLDAMTRRRRWWNSASTTKCSTKS